MKNNLTFQSNNKHSLDPLNKNSLLIQYPSNNHNNQNPNFMLKKSTLSKCITAFMFMLITFAATAQVHSGFSVSSANPQCLNGNSFSFTDTSTTGAKIASYSWDFGDGTTASGFTPSAHH